LGIIVDRGEINIDMKTASAIFEVQCKGILNIIRAADIYAIHVLSRLRSTEPDKDLIGRILKDNKISGYNISSIHYEKGDLIKLQKGCHLKEVGQQIVVATYTALESYLIDKFKEYYSFHTSAVNPQFVQESLKRIAPRGLSDIKRNYDDILDIHLPTFDMEFFSDQECSFHPKDSWDAICILSKARNEIVHEGSSKSYVVRNLMDSWYPFDFSRRWVSLFDANFDCLIYNKHETRLIKEYIKKKEKVKNL
jgi:hypothetical protein